MLQIFVKSIETAQIVVVTGTVPFYIFILVFLAIAQAKRVEELSTPFFKLCISSSVIDLYGVYGHLYFYIAWSTGICQAMSVSVLATNRLSAMIFPESYQKMWLGYRLKIAVAVQFLPGLLIGCFTFFNRTILLPNDHGGIVPKFVDQKMTSQFFKFGGAFLILNCLYLILAYCYLFWSLKKQSLKIVAHSNLSIPKQKTRRRERRLFIMCTIIVGVQLTILLFFSLKVLKFFELSVDEFYLFYNALSDLFASINPYLLWIFSDCLRKYVMSILGLKREKERRKREIPGLSILSVVPVA